ncbi:serine-rich adhesin for platelets [Zea mays]|nr:serine-rich adhesin for platelets [Zea mays]XP_008648427.1 serine-rich adhesin for platelets [Zea mays]|eukprot:XP_008648426.1 uncharacterized protein LOC103628998 [Zea mays]
MPPGEEGSTHGNIADGDAPRRRQRRRRIFRRSTERKNPENLEFERQVAAFEARQEQQRQDQMTDAFIGSLSFKVYFPHLKILSDDVQDGDSTQPAGKGRLLKDSAKPPDDTDFLEGTFIKINSDKQKATRNKKSGKNNKKKKKGKSKGKGKGRKQSHASEMQTGSPTQQPSSTCANATGGETSASSSSRVAVRVPLLEYSSSSSSCRVTAKLVITSAVNSASSGNEKELSASSSSDDFKSFESTTSYTTAASRSSANDYYTGGNAWNCTMGDYAGSLSDARSEPSLSASDYSTDSRGFRRKTTSGEGNRPNVHHQSFSLLAVGPGCSQEALLCSGYSSNGGDFQEVVSRKAAQKMKRMQRSTPATTSSSTMAASGPIVARAHFPRAPFREVITIGHYINDDTFYARKPNQKKGKYQKARSFSNMSSKTGYTTDHGDNVSAGSNRMLLITTVHQAKPRSGHHVTLEAIEETSSPSCLPNPKAGELKAMAPVGDGIIKDTDSKTPSSSDKLSSLLGHLDNSSCVDSREGQKKAMAAPVDGDTEDARAPPSSDKTSSLDNLDNPSYVGKEEQEEVVAPVGVGTEADRDSTAPTSDKTSLLGYMVNSSCVDRDEEQQNKAKFSTDASSSELDKIIEAVNNAYGVQQAASDVYMISAGIHADIENFLHAATPVIGQTSCTKGNMSLQDLRLWNVWSWYEEPECCGIEVQMQGKTNSSWPELSTYFVPLLSAVQLFGQPAGKSQSHGSGLVFEYFESENPFSRPPIFTKIKQLRHGVNLSAGNPIFGDPKQLESVKLSDLHPASWFCVAWYPICQIPAAAGSCQASFLTYHSLGKLVPQICSTDNKADAYDRMICPIVGLLAYKDQGEKWFQLREQQLRIKPRPPSGTDHAELLNKRLRALRQCASIMSKAVVPRAPSGEAMNYHSDYEFFLSRSSLQ